MFKIDKKGQSSSVFNLLIAALVSLAILGLLLSIMGVIDISGTGQNPSSIAVSKVSDASSSPYAPQTDTITFTSKYKNINSTAVAAKTNVGKENLLFYVCTEDSSITSDSENKSFNYTGTSSKKYTLSVVCGSEEINLSELNLKECSNFSSANNGALNCYLLLYPYVG